MDRSSLFNTKYSVFSVDTAVPPFYNKGRFTSDLLNPREAVMKVMISAEDNGKSLLSITFSFKEQEEGIVVARMLETFARNW